MTINNIHRSAQLTARDLAALVRYWDRDLARAIRTAKTTTSVQTPMSGRRIA